MPGTWNNVNERGYEDAPDGVGLWIPWTEIVDGDETNAYGVVLLKERNAYNYASNPSMSWHNANIRWGHPNVWSIGSEHTELVALFGGTSIGNEAPLGPAHQDTWNTPYGNDRFDLYAFAPPYARASMANWAPPSRMTVTFPGQNANVTGELTIIGTIHYADEVVLEWGAGDNPGSWSEAGMSTAEIPMVQSTIGRWNTGVVPAGTYTIRVRSYYAGFYSEALRTVTVTHQSISVAQSGGNFSTIQEGVDFAAVGDTVRVAMSSGAYPQGSITMKSGVILIATGGPIRDVFGDDGTPTITITDHDWPCYVEGFTFRHGHVTMTASGSADEHGALISGASPVFRNCTFKYNVADDGGGVLIVADPGVHTRPVFDNCTFILNRANVDGGAIKVEDAGTVPKTGMVGFECRDCTFVANYAATSDAASAVSVDYIGVQNEPIEFSNCHFSEHDVNATGTYDETTVLLRDVSSLTTFTDCSFFKNGTTDLIRMDSSDPAFDRCTFAMNYGADGVFGWLSTTNDYPEVTRSVLAFNNGPVAVGGSGLTSSMHLENSIVYLNNDQGRGPTDAAWDAAGSSTVRINPAFCNGPNFDFHLYAFSPASAPAPPYPGYFGERVGAYDVGCVPPADVTVTARPTPRFPGKPIVVACPKGDLDTLSVTVNLNGPITRSIDWREIVLDADGLDAGPTDSAAVFDQSGYVEAQGDAVGPDYVATIMHPYFGGHGNDNVNILLNGHPLASQAHFELRSIDISGDGVGNLVDLGAFMTHYPPPKPYSRYCDYAANEYEIALSDFAVFGAHYNHTKVTGHQQLNSEPIESNAGVALQFTEEFPTASTHRLYVDVSVENFDGVSASAFSMQSGSNRLSFVNWIPAGGSLGDVLFSPVIRDGAEELFFGVLVSEAFAGTGATLGRLVFDVSGAEPMEITEDHFVLTVGDVLLDAPEGNMVLATMESVFARTLDPAMARVYHDRLEQNFPNPFNPTTTLSFSLKNATNVNLTVYDVAGRRVRELVNEHRDRGAYKMVWDGQNDAGQTVASGVYFYKLVAGSFTDTKKMTILK